MSSSTDLNHSTSKYKWLAGILKQQIEAEIWLPREAIPSERQLEAKYKVSRPTIRQAIDFLERSGLVYREHGRGTFVSPQKLQKGMQELTSFSEDLIRRGIKPGQIIRSISKIVPSDNILQRLEMEPGIMALQIERIRLGDHTPIGLQTSYVVLEEGQEITKEDLEKSGSLYAILQEKFNIIPTEADETLEVTLATAEEANLLHIKTGAPLLLNERLTYNQNRKPVEFVKILYRGDRYRYVTRLSR